MQDSSQVRLNQHYHYKNKLNQQNQYRNSQLMATTATAETTTATAETTTATAETTTATAETTTATAETTTATTINKRITLSFFV
jgi:hypothetical protein